MVMIHIIFSIKISDLLSDGKRSLLLVFNLIFKERVREASGRTDNVFHIVHTVITNPLIKTLYIS